MSTISIAGSGPGSEWFSFARWAKHARQPLDAWSGRRRWLVALSIAATVFCLGAYGWVVTDLGGLASSRTALEAAAHKLDEARRALVQLPALRRQAAPSRAARPGTWSSADDVRLVSDLAAQNGMTLLAVEPGVASGTGSEAMRPVQFAASTDFVHLMAMLHAFADLPVLVVPAELTARRNGASLSVSGTLQVYSALGPAAFAAPATVPIEESLDPDGDDEDGLVFFDPFSTSPMLAASDPADSAGFRLVGLLNARGRGLALLETPDGPATVASGEQLGGERVTRLDAHGLTLARDGVTRMLALLETS